MAAAEDGGLVAGRIRAPDRAAGRCPRRTAARWAKAKRICCAPPNSPGWAGTVGDLVWDIGSAAAPSPPRRRAPARRSSPSTATPGSCARTEDSARRYGVQMQIVHGTAPHVLENLPEPDVGRSGGGGVQVVSAVADRRPQRIVTHAATRDAAELVGRDLSEHGYQVKCASFSLSNSTQGPGRRPSRSVAFLLTGRLPDRNP